MFFLGQTFGTSGRVDLVPPHGCRYKNIPLFHLPIAILFSKYLLFCSNTSSKVFDLRLAVALKKIFSASLKTGEEKIVRMAVSDFENVSRSIHFEYAALYKT